MTNFLNLLYKGGKRYFRSFIFDDKTNTYYCTTSTISMLHT